MKQYKMNLPTGTNKNDVFMNIYVFLIICNKVQAKIDTRTRAMKARHRANRRDYARTHAKPEEKPISNDKPKPEPVPAHEIIDRPMTFNADDLEQWEDANNYPELEDVRNKWAKEAKATDEVVDFVLDGGITDISFEDKHEQKKIMNTINEKYFNEEVRKDRELYEKYTEDEDNCIMLVDKETIINMYDFLNILPPPPPTREIKTDDHGLYCVYEFETRTYEDKRNIISLIWARYEKHKPIKCFADWGLVIEDKCKIEPDNLTGEFEFKAEYTIQQPAFADSFKATAFVVTNPSDDKAHQDCITEMIHEMAQKSISK
jgi:hypothetical protein